MGYGIPTKEDECRISWYQRKLASVDAELFTFRDITDVNLPNVTSILANTSKVPTCSAAYSTALKTYTENAGKRGLPDFNGPGSCIKKKTKRSPQHSIHSVFLTYWWTHCAPTGIEHVWIFEPDVIYTGDISAFLMRHDDNDADLIASGTQIANSRWWGSKCYKNNKMASISVSADLHAVTNVHPLPITGNPSCVQIPDDPAAPRTGFLFHQEHVARYSARLFQMLDQAIRENYMGPGEGLVSSLCATQTLLPGCKIFDFAPLHEREAGDTDVANWCWSSKRLRANDIKLRDEPYTDAWIHHVQWPEEDPDIC
jgi:hypothetical protein